MSDSKPDFHTVSGTGKALWGPGDMYTFLVSGEQAGNSIFAMEGIVPTGGGPPPHIHENEDETLYILEGKCCVQIGDQQLVASTGDSIFLPRGTVHAFRNDWPDTLRLIITFVPAGIEQFFEEVLEPVTDRTAAPPPLTKELVNRLLTIGPKYGIKLEIYYDASERLIADFVPGFCMKKKKDKTAWSQVRISEGGSVTTVFTRKGRELQRDQPARSTIAPKRLKALYRRASELIERSREKMPVCDDAEGRTITIQSEGGGIDSITLYGRVGGIPKDIKREFNGLWSDIAACADGGQNGNLQDVDTNPLPP